MLPNISTKNLKYGSSTSYKLSKSMPPLLSLVPLFAESSGAAVEIFSIDTREKKDVRFVMYILVIAGAF